ncbi:MAG: GNAT family N-acetyltransferase [Chloroflexi bacterium]|nr:GNAT family N-acetyltransferase [Chloroflexota bacterium]
MDRKIRDAMHRNSVHGLTAVGAALATATVAREGPWLLFDSGVEDTDSNQALVLLPAKDPVAAVEFAREWYRCRRTPFYLWLRDPDDLAVLEAAKSLGYAEQSREPAMLLESLPSTPLTIPGLDVRCVTGPEGAAAYADADAEETGRHSRRRDGDEALANAVSQLPGIQLFVGHAGGVPVARSMVVVSDGMAGITNIYVAPSFRRRGLGAAMTSVAAAAGRELGATAACLEASEMGFPVYERMGFRTIYHYVRLSPPPPTQ